MLSLSSPGHKSTQSHQRGQEAPSQTGDLAGDRTLERTIILLYSYVHPVIWQSEHLTIAQLVERWIVEVTCTRSIPLVTGSTPVGEISFAFFLFVVATHGCESQPATRRVSNEGPGP